MIPPDAGTWYRGPVKQMVNRRYCTSDCLLDDLQFFTKEAGDVPG